PADDSRPILNPGNATDPARELTADPALGALRHAPHLQATHIGSTGQEVPVRTPGHAIEEGVGVVEVPQDLDTGPGGWIPESDGTIPAGTGEEAIIGTPGQAVHSHAMAAQHASRPHTCHLPDVHDGPGTRTGQLGAVRTPGAVV